MSMRVYSKDLFRDVADTAAEGAARTRRERTRALELHGGTRELAKTEKLRLGEQVREARRHRLQKNWDQAEKETADNLQRVREKNARRREAKDRKFQRMLEQLDQEKAFTDEVEEYLNVRDTSKKRDKQAVYKEWCKNVYNPIQRDIQAQLDKTSVSELERRRREAFEEYIQTVNRKEGVFRDIIIEHDYDPLRHRALVPRYNGSKYSHVDPLIKDVTQIEHEQALVSALDENHVYIEPKPRESLDLLLWGKLDSTPYIRYCTENQVRHKKVVPGAKDSNESTFEFDHYKVPRDPALVKRQYFPGGKDCYLLPMRRRDNILHHYDNSYFDKPRPATE